MIHINEQSSKESSFLLNSQTQVHLIHNQQNFQVRPPVSQSSTQLDHDKPLLSYLFFSGQTSKVQQNGPCLYQHQPGTIGKNNAQKGGLAHHLKNDTRKQELKQKLKNNKARTANYRVKTDVDGQEEAFDELAHLRLENERLRGKLLRYEQSAVGLESVRGELEYYKKLTFLQQSEIQKLRKLLKQAQSEKLQLLYSHNYQPSIALKPTQPLHERSTTPKLQVPNQTLDSKTHTNKRSKQRAKRSIADKENSLGPHTLSEMNKGREELSYESRRQSTKKNSIAMKTTNKGTSRRHRHSQL